ncbi:MAG: phosphotransferase [Pseudomonadota bacterium]
MPKSAVAVVEMTDNSVQPMQTDDPRAPLREAFLHQNLDPTAQLEALPADASFRRYFRVTHTDRTLLVMDAPPTHENLPAYIVVDDYLRQHGFAAPEIIATDLDHGFALIEDFGDQTYTRLLAAGGDEYALYGLAIDVLADLHQKPMPDADSSILAYDQPSLLAEAALFVDWYWDYVMGTAPSAFQYQQFMSMMGRVMGDVAQRRECLVLRDYHVDNLMLRADQPAGSVDSCGLLDFQDARLGARAYDLMSLLEDARRDVSDELTQAMWDRYLAQATPADRAQFDADYRALAVGRHAKILGIFVRLNRRDGKDKYLQHLPRIAQWLARSLDHPSMDEVRSFLDAECPAWRTPPVRDPQQR